MNTFTHTEQSFKFSFNIVPCTPVHCNKLSEDTANADRTKKFKISMKEERLQDQPQECKSHVTHAQMGIQKSISHWHSAYYLDRSVCLFCLVKKITSFLLLIVICSVKILCKLLLLVLFYIKRLSITIVFRHFSNCNVYPCTLILVIDSDNVNLTGIQLPTFFNVM